MAEIASQKRPQELESIADTNRKVWTTSTADNNLTLYDFRRFKTTHLMNLRFLEEEIARIYQVGLKENMPLSSIDRLGLGHSRRDANVPTVNDAITHDFVIRLRKELISHNQTRPFPPSTKSAPWKLSLIDDEKQCILRDDLELEEKYITRLVRVDLGTRARNDPSQRWLHKHLRAYRYWRLQRKAQNDAEGLSSATGGGREWSYQNTILIAEIVGRVIAATGTAVFLIAPLAILSHESSKDLQLVVVSVWIVVLSVFVSLFRKTSSFEMMAILAAYAAVLSVFVSNVP
ncbi:hypothetical protein PTTW11_10292 [Pyrenophora teres f. teres]|uniref:DUF6594 domain-containing protein n=1 Tax=Pyrenophora teres f. teres TaxID=97479 RepID=A0A6S6WEB8_9PLEO|nr:hypothetical protein PTTW11_10292 [Pyrenophora teres f. teres]